MLFSFTYHTHHIFLNNRETTDFSRCYSREYMVCVISEAKKHIGIFFTAV